MTKLKFTGSGVKPLGLTMLSSMAGADFESALDRHVNWGIGDVDLKDGIYGKGIADIDADEAKRANDQIQLRGLAVYCFSSLLFREDVAIGESAFLDVALGPLDQLLATAKILGPRFIRLLAPQCGAARSGERIAWIDDHAPWLWDALREAVDRISDAGFECTIENEIDSVVIDDPDSALAFFERMDRHGQVSFTWDVQNMWQVGTYPSLEVYEKMRSLIGYYHLKGGRSETPSGPLVWRSSLADASWPVHEITAKMIADGHSPVICLNPSHGEPPGGEYINYVEADIAWMRENFG